MTKLIALIDGSLYAQSVCDHAAWAALRGPMAIELIHVLGRRSIASAPVNLSGSIGLGARTALLSELAELDEQNAKLAHKRGRLLLDEARASLIRSGVTDVMARLRNDDIVETVQAFEGDADVIVIGKRGEAAEFAKLHLGSNLERVARASHRPILVASRAFKPIERVLIAFDGGPSALKAVAFVAASPLFAGLACHLLCVGHDDAATRDKIDTASAVLYASGHVVTVEHRQGLADEIITRAVDDWQIDLLVMGAYGHSRIRNLIIGSTTTQMIRACKIPVMLFR